MTKWQAAKLAAGDNQAMRIALWSAACRGHKTWSDYVNDTMLTRWAALLTRGERPVNRMYPKLREFFLNLHGINLAKKRELCLALYEMTFRQVPCGEDFFNLSLLNVREMKKWLYEENRTNPLTPVFRVRQILDSSLPPIEKALGAAAIADVHDALMYTALCCSQAAHMLGFMMGDGYTEHRRHAREYQEDHWRRMGLVVMTFENDWRWDASWFTSDVVALSRGIWAEEAFDRMPILADALQDAGCDEPFLEHLRAPDGIWFRGNRVTDIYTGRR